MQSEVIRGNQRSSEFLRGTQRASVRRAPPSRTRARAMAGPPMASRDGPSRRAAAAAERREHAMTRRARASAALSRAPVTNPAMARGSSQGAPRAPAAVSAGAVNGPQARGARQPRCAGGALGAPAARLEMHRAPSPRAQAVPDEGRNRRSSTAIRGPQRRSEVLRVHQRQSEGTQRSSEANRGHERHSKVLTGHQGSSEAPRAVASRGHQGSSRVIRGPPRHLVQPHREVGRLWRRTAHPQRSQVR